MGPILIAAEFLAILLTSILAGEIYHLVTLGIISPLGDFIAIGILVATLYCMLLKTNGLYEPAQILGHAVPLFKLMMFWTGIFAFLALVAFIAKAGSHFSRGTELTFYLLALPVAGITRIVIIRNIAKLLASGRIAGSQSVIIFEPEEVGDGTVFNNLRCYGYMIIKGIPLSNADDYAKVADELTAYARNVRIDDVLILINWRRREEIAPVLTQLRHIDASILLLADQQVRFIVDHTIHHIGSTLAIELQRPPLNRIDRALKRSIDVVIAGIVLILLCPLLLTIAVLVSLDSPGPILFKQKRIGFNGRPFWIFKIRTMSVLENGACVKQAVENDRRVTRLGRWLRRTSIDELPQLLNVIRGDMSLVGPRPHAEAHDNAFDSEVSQYAWRRNVKPGITGWAQINGSRGATPDIESVRRRTDYDLWYIENWSLWLDLKIMLRTVPMLLGAPHAY